MEQKLKSYTNLEEYGFIKKELCDPAMNISVIITTKTDMTQNLFLLHYTVIYPLAKINKFGKYDIKINGSISLMSDMFNTSFYMYSNASGDECYSNSCPASIPKFLGGFISIIGLENKKTNLKKSIKIQGPFLSNGRLATGMKDLQSSFNPPQIASMYNFPAGTGSGQKIGIVELDGSFSQYDLDIYFEKLNLGSAPVINIVYLEGANQTSENHESSLDVQIIASICPLATITIYFAPNTMSGLYDAISIAGHNNDVVSLSWCGDETPDLVTNGYISSFQKLFTDINKPICISSGDNGSAGDTSVGLHVGFPASVPTCIACGGTTINVVNGVITEEIAWSGSGGGYSLYYTIPQHQKRIVSNLNRGVPDISANADPKSGYNIYNSSRGGMIAVGGTSAVSPLISSLFLLINESNNIKLQFLTCKLYKMNGTTSYKNIISGSNGYYTASAGWNPVTGLGVISGSNFSSNLISLPVLSPLPISKPTPASEEQIPESDQEQTQSSEQELTPSSDQKLTPSSDKKPTPSSDQEQTPPIDQEQTPITVQEQTPPIDQEQTPITVQEQAPSIDQEQTPITVQEPTPPIDQEQTPPTDHEQTPPTDQEQTPPSDKEPTLTSDQEQTPPTDQEQTLTSDQEQTPPSDKEPTLTPDQAPAHVINLEKIQFPAMKSAPKLVLKPVQIPTTTPEQVLTSPPVQVPASTPVQVPTPNPVQVPTLKPKQVPTPKPVQVSTPNPKQVPTSTPVQVPTPTPVQVPTTTPVQVQTPKPVQVPTPKPKQVPTTTPVQVPTPKPVQVPTPKPVQVPTLKPVQVPTPKPVQVPTTTPVQTPDLKPIQVPTPKPNQAPALNPEQVPISKPKQVLNLKPVQTSDLKLVQVLTSKPVQTPDLKTVQGQTPSLIPKPSLIPASFLNKTPVSNSTPAPKTIQAQTPVKKKSGPVLDLLRNLTNLIL